MEFTPVVVVNGNIGECVYRLKKNYGLYKLSSDWFNHLKTVL